MIVKVKVATFHVCGKKVMNLVLLDMEDTEGFTQLMVITVCSEIFGNILELKRIVVFSIEIYCLMITTEYLNIL